MPRHETDIQRGTCKQILNAIRHPSQIPTVFSQLVTGTREYYAAQDVVNLDRQELTELLSWTRKMTLKMSGGFFFLGILVLLGLVNTCRAAEPWTPDDFDWSSLKVAPRETWNGLYINLTSNPIPQRAILSEIGTRGQIGEHEVLFIAFSVGLAWQALQVAVGVGSLGTAIYGCSTNDGSAGAIASCAFGLAGTAISIGSAYKAASAAGWFARASNTWSQSGLENIALDVFNKRSQDATQALHEDLLVEVLRDAGLGEPLFMGRAEDGHRLTGRDDEHLHPHAPIYRIQHPKHGHIDIASREHINGTRFTLTFAHPELASRQSFRHERLSDHLMEARFDGGAERADTYNPSFSASGGYQEIEDGIKCYAGGNWQENSVLSAQMYDDTHHETFGFASLGIFENNNADSTLQDFAPRGMPLPVC